MGTAAARALARRGRRTALVEQFRIGHDRGSSHGASRIFRFAYHHPDYVRMAGLARDLWRVLEGETGEALLHTTGGLDAGPGARVAAEALGAAGVPFEWLRGEEAMERWPGLRFDAGAEVLFQPDAGVVSADRAVLPMARAARQAGAAVWEGTPVTALAPAGTGVEVLTPEGPLRADVAVVAAGAWAGKLLASAGLLLPLEVTLEQVAYFEQEKASALPTLIDWHSEQRAGYAVPDPARPGSLKLGDHMTGPVVDPDSRTFDPDPDGLRRVHEWAAHRFAGLRPTGAETCLYATTPDEDFVLDRIGAVVIGSACSGHGFKFAPLVGEWLAALATGDPPPLPVERFRASRPSLTK